MSWSTQLHGLPSDEAISQYLGRDHWLICGWVKRQTNRYSWFQVKQIALWASSSKPSTTWKNVKYIPYRSQIWVRVVSFICRKSISLTALIKHWNNYIRIYINLRKELCVSLSLSLFQQMTWVKPWVILTFHLPFHSFSLPERDLPHLQATKRKPSPPPVSCSIPGGNVWRWSNVWASWPDGEKKERSASFRCQRLWEAVWLL